MNDYGIHTKAMLAELSISQWTARKLDRKISDEIAEKHGVASDTGRYTKALLDTLALAGLQKLGNLARTEHYKRTLPWGDNGARLLPVVGYEDYRRRLHNLKGEFERDVERLLSVYPTLREQARARLNGLYCSEDYPDVPTLRGKFGFRVRLGPVPHTRDFRVELAESDVAGIRADMAEETDKRLSGAVADLGARLRDAVAYAAARLSDDKAKIYGSLVDNLREIAEAVPALNITGNAEIAQMAADTLAAFDGIGADAIRGNPAIREKQAAASAELLSRMDSYGFGA